MIRFRCDQCDCLLETDLKAGAVETCPECKLQLLVPQPQKASYVLWTEQLHEGKDKRGKGDLPYAQIYRSLRAKSVTIRLLGWFFAALSIILLICSDGDVPMSYFIPMVAACGVLLVGGVLLVAVAHLLTGICLIATQPERKPEPAV